MLAINPQGKTSDSVSPCSPLSVLSVPFRSRGSVFDSAPRFRPSPFPLFALDRTFGARTRARGPAIAGQDLRSKLSARPRRVDGGKEKEKRRIKKGERKNGAEEHRRRSRRDGVASLVKFGIWHNQRDSGFSLRAPFVRTKCAWNRFPSK